MEISSQVPSESQSTEIPPPCERCSDVQDFLSSVQNDAVYELPPFEHYNTPRQSCFGTVRDQEHQQIPLFLGCSPNSSYVLDLPAELESIWSPNIEVLELPPALQAHPIFGRKNRPQNMEHQTQGSQIETNFPRPLNLTVGDTQSFLQLNVNNEINVVIMDDIANESPRFTLDSVPNTSNPQGQNESQPGHNYPSLDNPRQPFNRSDDGKQYRYVVAADSEPTRDVYLSYSTEQLQDNTNPQYENTQSLGLMSPGHPHGCPNPVVLREPQRTVFHHASSYRGPQAPNIQIPQQFGGNGIPVRGQAARNESDGWSQVFRIYGTAIGILWKCATSQSDEISQSFNRWIDSQSPKIHSLLSQRNLHVSPEVYHVAQTTVGYPNKRKDLKETIRMAVVARNWPGDSDFSELRVHLEEIRKKALEMLDRFPDEWALRKQNPG